MSAEPETNFLVLQTAHREKARAFFRDPDNYRRLEKLCVNGERTGSIVFYYVKDFERDSLVRTSEGSICRRVDEYKAMLCNNKKRFYDLESTAGRGDLIWQGQRNPPVPVCPELGGLALPLPKLVAMQWFIQLGFDLQFWERFAEVLEGFFEHASRVKRKYTSTHREKKRSLRLTIEQEVIAQRSDTGGKKRKRSVYLTRIERKTVAKLLAERKRLTKSPACPRLTTKPFVAPPAAPLVAAAEGESFPRNT